MINYRLFFKSILRIKEYVYKFGDGMIRESSILSFLYLYLRYNQDYKIVNVKVCGVKKFCRENRIKILIIEKAQKRPVYIPGYLGENGSTVRFISPAIYITELEEVKICGECGAIFSKRKCLIDMPEYDYDHRFDYEFGPLEMMKKTGKKGVLKYKKNRDVVIERGIFLVGFAPYNYYHASIELLSKLPYVDERQEYNNFPILVDSAIREILSLRTLLKKINKKNRKIIWIEKNRLYTIKKLLYPSNNVWMPINLHGGVDSNAKDFLLAKSALFNIRNVVLDNCNKPSHRKIYVSRGKNAFNRLANELKVELIFASNGFEIIDCSKLTFSEQVILFSEAKVVAGTSGAAMTNLIYCTPGTKFICIVPKEYHFYLYSTIAYHMQMDIKFVDSVVLQRGKANSEEVYMVDLNDIYNLLKKL